MQNRIDFSKYNEKDLILIAQELLNLTYGYNLTPEVSKKGLRADLVYIVDSTKETEILVEVNGSRNVSVNEATRINNQIVKYFEVFRPNKIILFCFSTIQSEVYSVLERTLKKLVYSNFEIIQLDWIEKQLNEYPELASKFDHERDSEYLTNNTEEHFEISESEDQTETSVSNTSSNDQLNKLLSQNKQFFAAGHSWEDEDQFDRFIKEGIWENGHENKLQSVVNKAREGDFIFLKSTFVQGGVGTLRIKAIGVIFDNPRDGHLLHVNWQPIESIDLPGLGGTMSAINQIGFENVKRILEVLFVQLPDFLNIIDNLSNKRSKIDIEDNNSSINYWWLNYSDKEWNFDDLEVNNSRLYFGLDIKDDEKIKKNFYNINVGDRVIGYQTGGIEKTKFILEIKEKADIRILPRIELIIIQKIPIENQVSFAELNDLNYFKNSEAVKNNNQGSIFQLSEQEYLNIISQTVVDKSLGPIKNELTKTGLDNDGAYTTEDLLDIENDVRSFALILASKDIKPPIAVALFGKWGSGKSFFMEHLSKRVSELSINQGFVEESGTDFEEDKKTEKEDFCKGIAQIKFNAWSYLDANLWAGLVSSIFEKLDEYISNRSKGAREKLELRKQLSEKLEILSTEKKEVTSEIGSLEDEKESLKGNLETLIKEKDNLINDIAKKKLSEIVDAVRSKINIEEKVKVELQKYGITEERVKELSPSELFSEVNSWVTFLKNLFQFSIGYIILFIVAAAALLFVWIDPKHIATDFFEQIGREITAFISILGPLFAKGYDTFSRFKKIAQPVTDYKNRFNKELEEAKFEYEQEKSLLEIKIKNKQTEIDQAEVKITEIEDQIYDLNYTLNNFVAKRAFNNFIKRKVSDKRYEEHLGLISIIRKDFETLSELFQETQVDLKAPEEIQKEQQAKQDEHKKIVKLFEDEKVLNRIILYIDDLDRCSDEKVLEVIQAVHLLMAFPLFNVVVGVDKRCVNNALIYKNLLQYSKFTTLENIEKVGIHVISPSEYLEKIFQIPFQLDDPSDIDIKGMVEVFLKNQVEKEISVEKETPTYEEPSDVSGQESKSDKETLDTSKLKADQSPIIENKTFSIIETYDSNDKENKKKTITITPNDLKLTKEEIELLKEIIWLVGSIPRTVKRYLNIYRIIRAHQDLNIESKDLQKEFLTIMFLLAIKIGENKEYAPKLLQTIKLNKGKSLKDCLVVYKEFVEIKNKIENNDRLKELLQYKGDQFEKHIPLVGRFSFANIEYSNNIVEKELNAK